MNKEEKKYWEEVSAEFDNFFKEPTKPKSQSNELSLNEMYDAYIAPKSKIPTIKIPSAKKTEQILDGLDSLIDSLFDSKTPYKKTASRCITGSYIMTKPENYAHSASYISTSPKPIKPMTIGQLFDQLYKAPNTTPNPKNPTELEKLQDHVEHLNVIIDDLKEQLQEYTVANSCLKESNSQFQNDKSIFVLESHIATLKQNLQVTEENRRYATNHCEQQAKMLQDALEVINSLRTKVAESIIDKTNAEHLAKKSIQLLERNTLLKTDNCSIKEINQQLVEQNHLINIENNDLKNDIHKYQEQVARLLKEKIDYDCQANGTGEPGSLCGGCLSCLYQQSQHILDQTCQNYENTNKELEKYKNAVSYLKTSLFQY